VDDAEEADKLTTPWRQATGNQRSQRQERRLAKEPGGKKQINSGRHWVSKRDVRLNGYLVEARTTEKKSYSISRKEFEDITRDALSTPPGQLPGLQIDFEKPGSETLSLFVGRLKDHLYLQERIAVLEQQLREAHARDQEV
jgi:hypothetical protein